MPFPLNSDRPTKLKLVLNAPSFTSFDRNVFTKYVHKLNVIMRRLGLSSVLCSEFILPHSSRWRCWMELLWSRARAGSQNIHITDRKLCAKRRMHSLKQISQCFQSSLESIWTECYFESVCLPTSIHKLIALFHLIYAQERQYYCQNNKACLRQIFSRTSPMKRTLHAPTTIY